MLQYKYFHTGRGYAYRLSIARDAQDYLYYETLFQKMRSMMEGNTFVYAALSSGNSMFMQSTNDERSVFAHGMLADEMRDYPAKYINRFETSVDDPDSVGDLLPDDDLPSVSRRKPEFPTDKIFHQFVPKIVDALIYGDQKKKIIIITEGRDESERFMNAISALLPTEYMARVGFAIGANNVSNAEIKIPRNGGVMEDVSIRIWLPDLSNYRFENFANTYYVFDAKAGRDNYNGSGSSFLEVLNALNLSDTYEVGDFISGLNNVFSHNGEVDTKRLETLSFIHLLGLRKDPETARRVINGGDATDPVQVRAIVTAISVMLDPKNSSLISAGDFAGIVKLCATSDKINSDSSKFVIQYISTARKSFELLGGSEKQFIVNMLASDANAGKLCELYDSWWEVSTAIEQKDVLASALKISCDILDKRLKACSYRAIGAIDVLSETIKFFSKPIEDNAGNLFDIAFACPDEATRKYAIAMIMSPAYVNGGNSALLRMLIERFKTKCEKMSAKDQLLLILDLRNIIVEISEEIPSLGWSNPHNFFMNHINGRTLCSALIGVTAGVRAPLSNTIFEMLEMHHKLYHTDYHEMTGMIRSKLLDIDYVKSKIKSGSPELKKYRMFINNELFGVEIKSDIIDFLQSLEKQGDKNVKTSDARFQEILHQFYTFSDDDRGSILNHIGLRQESDLANIPQEKKKAFVEEVSRINKNTSKKRTKKFTFFADNIGMLWTVIFPIISLVLLLIPALVQWILSPDIEFMARIQAYLPFIVILIPMLELVGLTASYMVTKSASRKTKRTMIIGGLVNLPIVVFDIVYLVLYITSII